VRIALNLKGLAYEYVPVSSLRPGEYRRLNPQGLMPALRVGEHVIAQSTAILEYLEETYPERPLLPRDPIARAEVRAFAQLITSDLHPLNNNRVRRYLTDQIGANSEAVAKWYQHWVAAAFEALEHTLVARTKHWPFCFDVTPGWADLHLIPQIANARRFGCDLASYPRLVQIEEQCLSLEAFKRAAPASQPDYPGAAG
jgi:maleylacetoacetate isomerase